MHGLRSVRCGCVPVISRIHPEPKKLAIEDVIYESITLQVGI
jgi:hypothetical protein